MITHCQKYRGANRPALVRDSCSKVVIMTRAVRDRSALRLSEGGWRRCVLPDCKAHPSVSDGLITVGTVNSGDKHTALRSLHLSVSPVSHCQDTNSYKSRFESQQSRPELSVPSG